MTFVCRWFLLQNSHHQLQLGEALYNIYALIGMIRYESRRYLSERVVRVNFPRLILGLKEAPFSFFWIAKISIPLAVNELMSCYFA